MSRRGIVSLALMIVSFAAGNLLNRWPLAQAQAGPRIFEIRLYMDAMQYSPLK